MKYVYITYDPLFERILCVHDKPNQICNVCGKREYARRKRGAYQLQEIKRVVRTKDKQPKITLIRVPDENWTIPDKQK